MAVRSLTRLSTDLLVEILARVGGPTLASAACVCTGLRRAAREDTLWEELCRGTWPSTMESTARELVSSMPGGFAKFYADSLPLLLYKPCRRGCAVRRSGNGPAHLYPGDLVSFVDVYYRKGCVLSRVVHGIPVRGPTTQVLEYPFALDALSAGIAVGGVEAETGVLPSIALEPKEEGGVGVLNWALEEDLTLSWVLLDARSGRAVSISSVNPTAVERDQQSKGDLLVRFGCAVPVERQLLACGVAECVVCLRCQLSAAEDRLTCTGVELRVEDAQGAHVDWPRSLAVLETALCYESRTGNPRAAAEGYRSYKKDRREGRQTKTEGVAGKLLCALSWAMLFVGLLCCCYAV